VKVDFIDLPWGRSMLRCRSLGAFLLAAAVWTAPAAGCRAENAMFTFGEMVALHAQSLGRPDAKPGAVDAVLLKNLEFYAFTVFETLHAANNAAIMLENEPLFCAPQGAFEFEREGEIAQMSAYLAQELIALTKTLGGDPSRYDDKPASEALLLGLRIAFPCEFGPETLSAMR
jgi:hypothetical protein